MHQPTSLVKFMSEQSGNGRGDLHWARAGEDGAPFRGDITSMLTSEEYEERVVRVHDPHVDVYDIGNPEQRVAYQAVMDRIVNGWASCQWVDRKYCSETNSWIVYIEWVEHFMEDGMPLASHNPMVGVAGSGNGQHTVGG